MAQENNRSLLEILMQVANLPEYARKGAIQGVIDEWRKRSVLVEDVASGRTTFEAAIAALVAANQTTSCFKRSGARDTVSFNPVSSEAASRFSGIIPLTGYPQYFARDPSDKTEVTLTAPASIGWVARKTLGLHIFLFIVTAAFGVFLMSKTYAMPFGSNWHWALPAIIAASAIMTLGMFVFGAYPTHLQARRSFSTIVLGHARYLDRLISPT